MGLPDRTAPLVLVLEVPPPTYAAPPANTFLELRFGWRVKDKEEVVVRHRPWMFPRAIYF